MKIRIDMTGVRYGRLVGICFAHKDQSGHAHWLFLCDCGKEVVACGSNVRAGSTASCGCLHREISAARLTEHGHRACKRHDATYRAWQRMKKEHDASAISPAWFGDYARFLADMGKRPANMMLARINSAKPFGPSNCQWLTVATRSARATTGWMKRRDYSPIQPSGLRAPINQSKSAPPAAETMRASMSR